LAGNGFLNAAVSLFKLIVMKKFSIVILGCLLFSFQACLKDKLTRTYTILEPIYQSRTVVESNIKSNPPKEIQSPGKIFIYGNYIFLNEVDKGIHIIDNSNPSSPVAKAFIDIPGNVDIAVKGNTLYADMYGDLVTMDISNPLASRMVKLQRDVFPERNYTNGFMPDRSQIIVGWTKRDTTVPANSVNNRILRGGVFFDAMAASSSAPATPGLAGSMARFALVNDYLYAVDHHTLKCFSLTNAFDPQQISSVYAGWDIETIFPFKDKLFLGSMGGVFIYNISNPVNPVIESNFIHARACDPVIADNNYAFVTLRTGTTCGPANDELQILDIANLRYPKLVKTYAMNSPHGLAKDHDLLFICDGTGGLKMYDASDVSHLVLKKSIMGLETYDAIAWNNNLIVVAKDGLYQFDYTAASLTRKSKLTINH